MEMDIAVPMAKTTIRPDPTRPTRPDPTRPDPDPNHDLDPTSARPDQTGHGGGAGPADPEGLWWCMVSILSVSILLDGLVVVVHHHHQACHHKLSIVKSKSCKFVGITCCHHMLPPDPTRLTPTRPDPRRPAPTQFDPTPTRPTEARPNPTTTRHGDDPTQPNSNQHRPDDDHHDHDHHDDHQHDDHHPVGVGSNWVGSGRLRVELWSGWVGPLSVGSVLGRIGLGRVVSASSCGRVGSGL